MAAANCQAGPGHGRINLSRGFARRLNPGRCGKCAHGRSRMAATLVSRTRAGRGTRIGVHREVPRVCLALASHSGSCKHGCGDQCSRQKLNFSHSSSPLNTKANSTWLLMVVGLASGAPRRLANHRVAKIALLFRINQETGGEIVLFRRMSLAG
jgi:hypothetical protein